MNVSKKRCPLENRISPQTASNRRTVHHPHISRPQRQSSYLIRTPHKTTPTIFAVREPSASAWQVHRSPYGIFLHTYPTLQDDPVTRPILFQIHRYPSESADIVPGPTDHPGFPKKPILVDSREQSARLEFHKGSNPPQGKDPARSSDERALATNFMTVK